MKIYSVWHQGRKHTIQCDWHITTMKGVHEFHKNKLHGSEMLAAFPIEGTVIILENIESKDSKK